MRLSRGIRLGIGLAVIALGGGLTWVLLTAAPLGADALALLSGWSFIGIGLVVWARRPDNRTGPLMVLIGFAYFGNRLSLAEDPMLRAIGLWITPIHLAILVHALLALPTGRLGSPVARAIVAGIYIDFGLVVHGPLVFGPDGLGAALRQASYLVGAALIAAGGAHLVGRWRVGSAAWRRTVAPVLWLGALTLGALLAWGANAALGGALGTATSWALRAVFLAVPYSFLAVQLRSHLARASVAGLVVELEKSREAGAMRDALAGSLGDPSLEIAYWLDPDGRWVDIDGRAVELPGPDDTTTATLVERDGRRVAAIVHDRTLDDDAELIRAVGAAAALALDNERLQAELRARLDELSASRARIVRAADEERKRIERNLHDGTQQRLTSIAMALGLAESELKADPRTAEASVRQAKEELAAALAELRDISQGIHPGILTTSGLDAAVRDLAYAAPIAVNVVSRLNGRLPEPVEAAAYYVIAEGLANVVKHAHASAADVTMARETGRLIVSVRDNGLGAADPLRGTGLRGLTDRVQALGGSLELDSRRGHGTKLRAIIPCA